MRKYTWFPLFTRALTCAFGGTITALVAMSVMAPMPALAEETALKQYEVELVIFRVTNPTGSPEDWALEEARAKANAPIADDATEPTTTTTSGTTATLPDTAATALGSETSIQLLEGGHYKLTGVETTLKRSHSYQLLAHTAWSQPGFAREMPRPVDIVNLIPTGTGITGSVTLTRGTRLLHLQLDLTYQAPDGQHYVLREQRAVRSGEKHYFDHPYFGVVAIVTPKTN